MNRCVGTRNNNDTSNKHDRFTDCDLSEYSEPHQPKNGNAVVDAVGQVAAAHMVRALEQHKRDAVNDTDSETDGQRRYRNTPSASRLGGSDYQQRHARSSPRDANLQYTDSGLQLGVTNDAAGSSPMT